MKRAFCGVLLMAAALAGWNGSRLRWDADVLNALPAAEPAVRGLQLQQKHFAAADELIVRVGAGTEAEALRVGEALAMTLRRQTGLVAGVWWKSPFEEDPKALAVMVAEAWLNAAPAQVERLREELSSPAMLRARLDSARERLAASLTPDELARLSYDPLGLTSMLDAAVPGLDGGMEGGTLFQSEDGRQRFLYVKPAVSLPNYRACRDWLEEVQQVIRHWQLSNGTEPELAIGYTGRPAFMAEIGGGMERDLSGPAAGTLLLIAVLFYAVHRSGRAMFWLLVLLILNVVLAVGVAGMIYGSLNVVSLGFAAILLGLAADYAFILLQEARVRADWTADAIRRRVQASIYWSAATTAGAFLLLNFSALPGLGQLGTLVALGIGMAALLMSWFYLPPLRGGLTPLQRPTPASSGGARHSSSGGVMGRLAGTAGLAGGCAAVLVFLGGPPLQKATEALRPQHSEAYQVWDEWKRAQGGGGEPLVVVLRTQSAQGLYEAAQALRRTGEELTAQGVASRALIPIELIMDAPWRGHNLGYLRAASAKREALLRLAMEAGFSTNAMELTLRVMDYWAKASETVAPALPEAVQWLRGRCFVREDGCHVFLGLIYPAAEAATMVQRLHLPEALRAEWYVTGWEWMGQRLARMVLQELPWLLTAMGGLVAMSLWLALRSWRMVGLSAAALGFSVFLLLAGMRLAGRPWNLMNLMALPLMLGLGVDYCLHLLMALRRCAGDWRAVHQSVGKALLLAGITTAGALASLTFSSNAGVASLGEITAGGVAACLITALGLLPAWELATRRPSK